MKKYLIAAIAAVIVAGIATPVFAEESAANSSSSTREKLEEAKLRAEQAAKQAREKAESAREQVKTTRDDVKELVKSQKEQIEQRRAELKQNIETSRAQRKAELTDKRLEICQQRESKINELIKASAKLGRERLTLIQQIESKVKDFYVRKQLSSTEYDAALALVDEKEAQAIAAVEMVESQEFDCVKVDGEKPSGEIKALHQAKHAGLNDYRDSVKQLIQIVKAAAQAKSSEGSAS